MKHWIDGGETAPGNMTLLCTYHHRMVHEGGFSIVRDADGALRFVTADGRTIPRCGFRRDDFVDDPAAEGFCTNEVREPAAVYLVRPSTTRALGGVDQRSIR